MFATSSAPQDPIFWPLHGLGERRRVAAAERTVTSLFWPLRALGKRLRVPHAGGTRLRFRLLWFADVPLLTQRALSTGERLVQLLRLMDDWGDLSLDEVRTDIEMSWCRVRISPLDH